MTHSKTTRIEARINSQTKQLIAQAAELTGRSLNEFLAHAATKEAVETVRQMSSIDVSTESANRMLERLDNPEPINEKLRAAALNQADIERRFKHPEGF